MSQDDYLLGVTGIDVLGENRDHLPQLFELAMGARKLKCAGMMAVPSPYQRRGVTVEIPAMGFGWKDIDGLAEMPVPLGPVVLAAMVSAWLDDVKYADIPRPYDGYDGSHNIAWRFQCGGLLERNNSIWNQGVDIVVTPCWTYYGK